MNLEFFQAFQSQLILYMSPVMIFPNRQSQTLFWYKYISIQSATILTWSHFLYFLKLSVEICKVVKAALVSDVYHIFIALA